MLLYTNVIAIIIITEILKIQHITMSYHTKINRNKRVKMFITILCILPEKNYIFEIIKSEKEFECFFFFNIFRNLNIESKFLLFT